MSYDNIISRQGAAPLMKQSVQPVKGLAGPAKTQPKPPAHKPTKHK
jgi:hypothetical protein